jgi:hypothetical protein
MAAAMNEGKAEFNGDAGEAEQVAEVSADEQAEVVAEAVSEEGK